MRTGSAFTGSETRGSPPVVMINETLAKQFFPGVNPIGQRIKWGSSTSDSPWWTIVGVAGDVRGAALDAPQQPAIYFPALQADTLVVNRQLRSAQYVVRVASDPSSVFASMRQAVRGADADLPIVGPRLVADGVAGSLAGRTFNTALLSGFALLALALAAVGIYGLMAYAVTQRTREIGIRLAIGATSGDVLRLVVTNGARIALTGVALGVVGALGVTRLLRTQLFDVSPLDPAAFLASAAVLLGVAILATFSGASGRPDRSADGDAGRLGPLRPHGGANIFRGSSLRSLTMSLGSFFKKQFIDVIQWTEDAPGVLQWRFPMEDMEIQNGAQLTVRESQMAVFVNEGVFADVFSPGLYTLTTQTLPLLTNLRNWDKLFQSPFKSDVYFFSTRQQTNQRWGTPMPVTIRDKEFGAVRLRANGLYSYHVSDPAVFHQKAAATQGDVHRRRARAASA